MQRWCLVVFSVLSFATPLLSYQIPQRKTESGAKTQVAEGLYTILSHRKVCLTCRFSMIARKIPSTGYPTSSTILTPKDPRSSSPGVYLGLRVNKTAFSFGRMLYHHFPLFHLARPSVFNNFMSWEWSIRSAADGDRLNSSPTDDSSSGTRLVRAIQAIRVKLETRIRELRKNFPMKLLFFLMGFYSATAFATVIGQTGDWDILSAALAVAVVEGIGALMYKASLPLIGKLRGLIIMFNYWKAGLSLGLFLDSFKY